MGFLNNLVLALHRKTQLLTQSRYPKVWHSLLLLGTSHFESGILGFTHLFTINELRAEFDKTRSSKNSAAPAAGGDEYIQQLEDQVAMLQTVMKKNRIDMEIEHENVAKELRREKMAVERKLQEANALLAQYMGASRQNGHSTDSSAVTESSQLSPNVQGETASASSFFTRRQSMSSWMTGGR